MTAILCARIGFPHAFQRRHSACRHRYVSSAAGLQTPFWIPKRRHAPPLLLPIRTGSQHVQTQPRLLRARERPPRQSGPATFLVTLFSYVHVAAEIGQACHAIASANRFDGSCPISVFIRRSRLSIIQSFGEWRNRSRFRTGRMRSDATKERRACHSIRRQSDWYGLAIEGLCNRASTATRIGVIGTPAEIAKCARACWVAYGRAPQGNSYTPDFRI